MKNIFIQRYKKEKESIGLRFGRLWSYPLTWFFYKTPFTPNQITFFGFLMRIAGAALFVFNNTKLTLLGGLILWLGSVLDYVDGEIARLKNMQSTFGGWFDGILDRISEVIIFTAIGINIYFQNPAVYSAVIGMLSVASTLLWRSIGLQTKIAFKIKEPKIKHQPLIGFDVALQNLIIVLGAVFNRLYYVALFFIVLMALGVAKNLLKICIKKHP